MAHMIIVKIWMLEKETHIHFYSGGQTEILRFGCREILRACNVNTFMSCLLLLNNSIADTYINVMNTSCQSISPNNT